MEPRAAIQHLFELPKFDDQKEFCRSLASQANKCEILREVVSRWGSIPSNRKDKFFYLVSLILPRAGYSVLSIEDTELRNYCFRLGFVLSEDVVRYVAVCEHRSTLAAIREGVSSVERRLGELSLELGKDPRTKQANREVLYEIYEKSMSAAGLE